MNSMQIDRYSMFEQQGSCVGSECVKFRISLILEFSVFYGVEVLNFCDFNFSASGFLNCTENWF